MCCGSECINYFFYLLCSIPLEVVEITIDFKQFFKCDPNRLLLKQANITKNMADERRRLLKLSFQADTVKTSPIIKPQSAPDRTRWTKQYYPIIDIIIDTYY